MGQAKNRGSFEERKRAAIDKKELFIEARRKYVSGRPSAKHNSVMTTFLSTSLALGLNIDDLL